MVSEAHTWCPPKVCQMLECRCEKLRALWNRLEQKHLDRRRRNLQTIDALAAKKLERAYIRRADQIRLRPKSREDAARCAQYEGEIAMITAALRGLASPSDFADAITKARAGTHLHLSREEVASYRRGLERQFIALSALVPKELLATHISRRVVNTPKRPVGWRVRSTTFEVSLQRAAPMPEPEFLPRAQREAPERVRTAMLLQRILSVAEHDLALCESGQVRKQDQLGVIARAQTLKILHQLSVGATSYDDLRKAMLEVPRKSRFRLPRNEDAATFQALLNDTFRQIKADVNSVLAGKSPKLVIRATRPSSGRVRQARPKSPGDIDPAELAAALNYSCEK